MKTGRNLMELAREVERRENAKRDFLADTRKMEMTDTGSLALHNGEEKAFPLTPYCGGQVAARLGIPKAYYDRMLEEAPTLLARNCNHWFEKKPETRMLRTLDGNARAFLSSRYRTLDNLDMMEAILPTLLDQSEIEIVSCEVTDMRLYIKAVFPKIQGEVKKDDIVQAGLVVSNSEIGAGSVRIEPLLYRLVCLNGMIASTSMRKYHVGRANGDSEQVRELLTDKTKELSDQAFWHEVRDVVKGSLKADIFEGQLNKLRQSFGMEITKDPLEVIELSRKRFGFTEDEKGKVLTHLISGAELNAFGLANAITRASQDVSDYDRATELERIGGQVIELPKKDWEVLAA